MDKGLDLISAIGRAAVGLSRTSMEAANMAGNSVDEAVEQFLAGWTGTPSPVKGQSQAAAGRQRPPAGDGRARPSPQAQRRSSSGRQSNASPEARVWGESIRQGTGGSAAPNQELPARLETASSPSDEQSNLGAEKHSPELRQELRKVRADLKKLKKTCSTPHSENVLLREKVKLSLTRDQTADQMRGQVEVLLAQKSELAFQKLQLELNNERLQALLDYSLDCRSSPCSSRSCSPESRSCPPAAAAAGGVQLSPSRSCDGWSDLSNVASPAQGTAEDACGSPAWAISAARRSSWGDGLLLKEQHEGSANTLLQSASVTVSPAKKPNAQLTLQSRAASL
ncbi:hypothetical protein WJX73_003746 [Symbiochloris irregularis]|uniref:Uncharacterized protein n=1 Tax=Symbiochloris irregularis TaxID=706552 RepID=A0AAW1P0S2_9CHLO